MHMRRDFRKSLRGVVDVVYYELDHSKYTYAAQMDACWMLLDVETGEISLATNLCV